MASPIGYVRVKDLPPYQGGGAPGSARTIGDHASLGSARVPFEEITPALHAASHITGGTDVIAAAVAAGASGLMTGADKTKLNGIAAGADVTATALAAALVGLPFAVVKFSGLFTGGAGAVVNYAADGGPASATVAGAINYPATRAITIKNLIFDPIASALAGTLTVAVYKNGSASAVTCTVGAGSTAQASDLTHTVGLTQGQSYDLGLSETGAGTLSFSGSFELCYA